MVEDFTSLMQANDNDKVNEICTCDASSLTYSRRTDLARHAQFCPYKTLVSNRAVMLKWQPMIDKNEVPGDELRLTIARMLENAEAAYRQGCADPSLL